MVEGAIAMHVCGAYGALRSRLESVLPGWEQCGSAAKHSTCWRRRIAQLQH